MKKNLMLIMMGLIIAMMFATPVKAAGFSGSFDIEDGTFVESVPEVPETTPEVTPVVPETTPEVTPVVPETTPEVTPVVPETTPEVTPVVPETTPEVTPVVPETTPEVTPVVPETTPEVTPVVPETTPEVTPVVPETTPEVPETTPEVPETTPEVTPVVPETTPEVPETTPEVTPVVPEVSETPEVAVVEAEIIPEVAVVEAEIIPEVAVVEAEIIPEVAVVEASVVEASVVEASVDSAVETAPVVAKAYELQSASLPATIQNTSDEEVSFENTSRVGFPLWGALAVLAVLFLGRYRIVSVCTNEDGEEENTNLGNYFLFDSALKEMLNHANSDAVWERLVIVNKFRLPGHRKAIVQERDASAYSEWMNRSEQRVAENYMGYTVPFIV